MSEDEVNEEAIDLADDADLKTEPEMDEAEELAHKEALRAQLMEAKQKAEKEKALKSEDCPPCNKGSPAWMATFADMATLLMAFFVLILSFAEFNVPKFKQISGSMKNAFGIQRVVPVVEPPKGTTVLSLNFSPNPTPAVQENLKQQTTEHEQSKVE